MPVIGNPIPLTIVGDTKTRFAPPSSIYGETFVGRIPTYLIRQGEAADLNLSLRDENSELIFPSSLLENVSLACKFVEATDRREVLATIEDITDYDPDNAVVTVSIPEVIFNQAGVYEGYLGFHESGQLVKTVKFRIFTEPSPWGTVNSNLPSIQDCRMLLRDSSLVENELLGEHQFALEEIVDSIVNTVELWNSTPPPILQMRTTNFHDRSLMLVGVETFLFHRFIEWLRKNRLPYQAGGIATDEMNKLGEYLQAYQVRYQELVQRITKQKVMCNIRAGFARLG